MKPVFEYACLKDYLADWVRARPGTRRLSQNAAAKYLGMTSSMLSQVLGGKKNISLQQAALIAKKLALSPKESAHLGLLADLALQKAGSAEASALAEKIAVSSLDVSRERVDRDLFQYFANWYSIPVFELCTQEDSLMSAAEIAHRLELNPPLVEETIARLERVGMIVRSESGGWSRSNPHLILHGEMKSLAIRNFHKEMLEKAKRAIETQTKLERVVGTETFRFAPAYMDEARAAIHQCLDTLLALEEKSKREETSCLYHAGIQFFRLADFPAAPPRKKAV